MNKSASIMAQCSDENSLTIIGHLQILVKAAKNCPHCSQIFLDSEEDHHDPKNMAVALCFHAEKFTRVGAATWLAERGFKPLLCPKLREGSPP